MSHVADLVAAGHEVAITHGNGPQVGNILVKNELAAHVVPPVPLDWCGAQTQGTIGFTMLDALEESLARRGVQRPVAAIVTRTLVDPDDPGFTRPTKPVGRYLSKDEAEPLIALGQVWEDRGAKGWRRVVASPEPLEVLDAHTLLTLMQAGYVAVAAGGGGIPVVRSDAATVHGVEAVIDKDLTAALLARAIDADALVIATDVPHAVVGWGTPEASRSSASPWPSWRSTPPQGTSPPGRWAPRSRQPCGSSGPGPPQHHHRTGPDHGRRDHGIGTVIENPTPANDYER